MKKLPNRYCGMCDKRVKQLECPFCGADTDAWPKETRRLTRQEQLEGLADRGIDTWDDYREER